MSVKQPSKSRLLQNRGIGKRYLSMSLTDYPHAKAKDLIDWLEDEASQQIALGNGVIFFGETQEGYDISVLTSRAFILTGMEKLRCFSFHDTLDHETINMLWQEKYPVMITNFYPDHTYVDPERYKRLENLLNYYLDNSIPFFLHIPVEFSKQAAEYGNLMSPVFLDRILKNNKTFAIG